MTKGDTPSNERRRPDRAALAIAVFLAGLAGLIFWDSSRLAGINSYSGIGPSTIPFVIACGLLLLAAWTVFEALRGDFPERERQEIAPVVWIIGGLIAQMLLLKGTLIDPSSWAWLQNLIGESAWNDLRGIVLWDWIATCLHFATGFSIATGVLFAAAAAGFGRRKLWFTIPAGILLSLGIWLIFAGLLQLSLPAGPLEHLFW